MKTLLRIISSPLTSAFIVTVGLMTLLSSTAGGFWTLFGLLGIPLGFGLNVLIGRLIKKLKNK